MSSSNYSIFALNKTTDMIKKLQLFLLLGVILNIFSCTSDEDNNPDKSTRAFSHTVATDWFDLTRGLTKTTPGFSPPVASRAFGYCGVALYQSVLAGMPNYKTLENQLSGLSTLNTKVDPSLKYNWEIIANAALANMCKLLYPTATDSMKNLINTLETLTLDRIKSGVSDEVVNRSIEFGKSISDEIFEWSKTDNGHEGYTKNFPASYVVPQGPGLWVPTSSQKIPLQPYWGDNRTFVPNNTNSSQPALTITFSEDKSSAFYKQALEVFETSETLTPEQTTIAKYWSDDAGLPGTPPGHSISILTQIIRKENLDLAKTAEIYAKVGMALSDAFVSCWKCKYVFNLLRPVTYIQANIDPSWKTLLNTPPFPEFTSGHSAQSGAFSAVMSNAFGSSYSFTDRTHELRTDIDGTPRIFNSFKQMASEAAISRLYGGIHYREAIDVGVAQGEKVGSRVLALNWK